MAVTPEIKPSDHQESERADETEEDYKEAETIEKLSSDEKEKSTDKEDVVALCNRRAARISAVLTRYFALHSPYTVQMHARD